MPAMRSFVAGGAGFIGSHLSRRLLDEKDADVVIYDNFSSGREAHLDDLLANEHLTVVRGDLQDLESLVEHSAGTDRVFLLAANPDIARAATEPAIDFWQGTYLTHNMLEACRINGIPAITYSSGSGIYGDLGHHVAREDSIAMGPVSTYGASKLACEAEMSAYSHMFGLRALVFRFANVVGPRQTHGVTYDFVRRLLDDPSQLTILGDGNQSKSYIHVDDVLDAMFLMASRHPGPFDVYNAGTDDYATVREIAELTAERLQLENVQLRFKGGAKGWAGDVPVVRFGTSKLRAAGWSNRRNSREALLDAVDSSLAEARRERAEAPTSPT